MLIMPSVDDGENYVVLFEAMNFKMEGQIDVCNLFIRPLVCSLVLV